MKYTAAAHRLRVRIARFSVGARRAGIGAGLLALLLPMLPMLPMLAGCGGEPKSGAEGQPAEPGGASAPVRLAVVRAASGVVTRLAATSLVTPDHAAALAAPVAARVLEIRVAEGDLVQVGAKLVRLRSPTRIAARARQASAGRQLEVVRGRLAQVVRLQREGLADGGQRFALEREIAALSADVELARAELRATAALGCDAAAEPQASGDAGDDLWLCAPIAGVVAEVAARVGASVDAASPALVTLSAAGPLRVQLERFEPLPNGATLVFSVPFGVAGEQGRHVPLRATPMSERVAADRGSILAVHLAEPATSSFAGVRGVVEVQTGDGVLAVPHDAISLREGVLCVFRQAKGGAPEPLAVEVLGQVGAEVLVRASEARIGADVGKASLLRAGDTVLAVAPSLAGGGGD